MDTRIHYHREGVSGETVIENTDASDLEKSIVLPTPGHGGFRSPQPGKHPGAGIRNCGSLRRLLLSVDFICITAEHLFFKKICFFPDSSLDNFIIISYNYM